MLFTSVVDLWVAAPLVAVLLQEHLVELLVLRVAGLEEGGPCLSERALLHVKIYAVVYISYCDTLHPTHQVEPHELTMASYFRAGQTSQNTHFGDMALSSEVLSRF